MNIKFNPKGMLATIAKSIVVVLLFHLVCK